MCFDFDSYCVAVCVFCDFYTHTPIPTPQVEECVGVGDACKGDDLFVLDVCVCVCVYVCAYVCVKKAGVEYVRYTYIHSHIHGE